MKMALAVLLGALYATPAVAQENRFVTFKTINDKWGRTQHQVDRNTIRQEGPYKIFWSRIWMPSHKQPVAISVNERLHIWSQKFAVDCAKRRITAQFIDSTNPYENKRKANLQTVRWRELDKYPTVNRAVCAGTRSDSN